MLKGVRVLDLTAMWSGPAVTRALARLGADVVKIESRARLDGTREQPRLFATLNAQKRSLLLDLRTATDRELFLRLAGRADVMVDNFSPRVLRSFGLTYDLVSRDNPGLVMLSMPAYGGTGPHSNRIGFGWELEASGGLADLMRDSPGNPVTTGIPLPDPAAGAFGALAVLAALLRREMSGCGCHLDLAQRDVVLSLIGERFLEDGPARHEAPRCFLCLDGWIAVTVPEPHLWPDFDDGAGTGPDERHERLAVALRRRTRSSAVEWLSQVGGSGVPVAACAPRTAEAIEPPRPDADRAAVLADWLA